MFGGVGGEFVQHQAKGARHVGRQHDRRAVEAQSVRMVANVRVQLVARQLASLHRAHADGGAHLATTGRATGARDSAVQVHSPTRG
jgi:hypothetical protein